MAGEKENLKNLKKQNEEYQKRLTLLEKSKNLQSDSFDSSVLMVESLKETLGITSKLNQFDATLLGLNKKINKEILNQRVSLTDIKSIDKQILKNADLINKSKTLQKSLQKDIKDEVTKEGRSMAKAVGDAKGNLTVIQQKTDLLKTGINHLGKQVSLSEKDRKMHEKDIASREERLKIQVSSLSTSGQQLLFAEKNTKELKKQNDERAKERKVAEKIKDSLGVAGGLTKLLGTIPGIGGVASEALSEVTKELEEAANNSEEIPNRFQTMTKVLGKVGKGLIKNLTDPMVIGVALIGQFVKALKATDREAGEMAKQFGISYQHALHHSKEANHMALTYGDIMVSNRDIEQAQVKINKHFGTAVHFSETMAANFASIQKRTGHSDETMGFFAKSSMAAGKEVKDILLDTHKVVLEQNSQNKMSLNVKDVQEGIAKTSKSIQLTSKLNTKELANAVIEAKKLGISLSEVEGIANHILDFESSIQSELEAELLLGKDINLEKARQLALEGNMEGVAKEVLKNKAIMNAFDTKNVIAQDAAAKALGMNREQLAGMVMEQKNLAILQEKMGDGVESMSDAQGKYSKLREDGVSAEAAALLIGDESLANQLESVSQAEKFEATLARVQEVFVAMATPVLSMVDGIVDMAGGAERLANMLKVIGTIWVGIKGAQLISLAYAKLQTKEDQKQLAFKTGSAAAFDIANPFIALAGIVVAAGIAGVIASQMKDGMIDSKGGMVVSGPKGSIQLDKNDSIVAGTDLGGGGNTNTENNKMAQEQLQESKTQNQLLSQLIGNTNKLKDLDNVGFYEVQ